MRAFIVLCLLICYSHCLGVIFEAIGNANPYHEKHAGLARTLSTPIQRSRTMLSTVPNLLVNGIPVNGPIQYSHHPNA